MITKILFSYVNNSAKHQLVARVVRNNDCLKTKTLSISSKRSLNEAYKLLIQETKLLASQYHVRDVQIPPFNELTGKSSNTDTESLPSNPLIDKFGHLGQFKAMIKLGIKTHGTSKMEEALTAGLQLVLEVKEEEQLQTSIINDTNMSIAKAILAAREKGVHMDTTPAVEAAIESILANKSVPGKMKTQYAGHVYKLGKEMWDGLGQMPTGMANWLNEDESRTLTTLKIS